MAQVDNGAFPTTHWSVVGMAGHGDPGIRRAALQRLLHQYIAPMELHLRLRYRLDGNAAEEIVQQFIVSKVIERHIVAKADQGRGRFRTFLMTALDRFAASLRRRHRADRFLSLDDAPEAAVLSLGPSEEVEAAWAREVIASALARMKEFCINEGREDLWLVFHGRIIGPLLQETPQVPYGQLIEHLELNSAVEGFNRLATAKRIFARSLRSVIAEYEKDERQIEQELADLQVALASRGRLNSF